LISERQFKSTTDIHPYLMPDDPALKELMSQGFISRSYIIDSKDQTWTPGNLICVVRANESIDDRSIFAIAAVMQRNISITSELNDLESPITMVVLLRRITLTWRRIGPRLTDKLLSLPSDYADNLGDQITWALNHSATDADAHVCGIVKYQFQERPTYIIPFCGMVNYNIDE
jgi:hypothetical protein